MKIEKNGNANQTNDQEQVNQSDAPWLAWLNIALDAYREDERSRVDRLKRDIASDQDNETLDRYQQERDFRKPSTLRKVGRVALDVMRIHPQSSEQRRDREAMSLAISEHDAETKSQRQWRDWVQKKQAASERLRQEEEDRKEAEALERDMVEAMDVMRRRSHELTIGQRNQEIIEREINSRLLTVDKLEEEVLSGSHEVSKGVIDYDGAQIPIYYLKGIPFSMLSHAVDFRRRSWESWPESALSIGGGTSKKLFNDPSIWNRREDDASVARSYLHDAKGNLICASYISSENNIDMAYKGELRYGFDKIPGGSLLGFALSDAGSTNHWDEDTINDAIRELNYNKVLNKLNKIDDSSGYNEVVMKRYSDTGSPLLPSYIITESGKIVDQALRHAKYFNIPIVDISRELYDKKYEDHIEKLVNSLDRDADYVEVARIDSLIHLIDYSYNRKLHLSNYYAKRNGFQYSYEAAGDGKTERRLRSHFDEEDKESDSISDERSRFINQCIARVGQLEYDKRIDFIVDKINDIADAYRKANNRGEYLDYGHSGADVDVAEGLEFLASYHKACSRSEIYLDGEESAGSMDESFDTIYVEFVLPSDAIKICTRIVNFSDSNNNDENDPTFGKVASAFFGCYEMAKKNRRLIESDAKPETDLQSD